MARVNRKFEWLYVYGFMHPPSGRVEWLFLPKMNTQVMNIALAEFAQAIGAGPTRQIVLLLDGAPSHHSRTLVVPDGLHLVIQPAYSPEIQPSERLWPLLRESLANQAFTDLDDLEDKLVDRCCYLDQHPEVIRNHTHFHWWPNDISVGEGRPVK